MSHVCSARRHTGLYAGSGTVDTAVHRTARAALGDAAGFRPTRARLPARGSRGRAVRAGAALGLVTVAAGCAETVEPRHSAAAPSQAQSTTAAADTPESIHAPWRRFSGEFTLASEVRRADGSVLSANTTSMRVERARGADGRAVSTYTWSDAARGRRPASASDPVSVTIDDAQGTATLKARSGRVLLVSDDKMRGGAIAALPPEFRARLAAMGTAPVASAPTASAPADAAEAGRDLTRGILLDAAHGRARVAELRRQSAGTSSNQAEHRITRGDTVVTLTEDTATGLPAALAFSVRGEPRGRVAFSYAPFGRSHFVRSSVELERPVRAPDGRPFTLVTRYTVRNVLADSTAP